MSKNIVLRLREDAPDEGYLLCQDAAKEIERLNSILGYYTRNELAGRDKVERAAAMEQAIRMVIDWYGILGRDGMPLDEFISKYGPITPNFIVNALRTVLGEKPI